MLIIGGLDVLVVGIGVGLALGVGIVVIVGLIFAVGVGVGVREINISPGVIEGKGIVKEGSANSPGSISWVENFK